MNAMNAVVCSGPNRISFQSTFLSADEAEIRVASNACDESIRVLIAYLEEGRVSAARNILNDIHDDETLMQCFLLAFSTRFESLYIACAERLGEVRKPVAHVLEAPESSTSMSSMI